MATNIDLRTYLVLERAFVRRLQRSWRQQSAPTYEKIAQHCRDHQWDKARQLVPDLDMAEVGTENREWIQYMLLSFAVFGAGTVSRKKPSFVGVGTFDTFLKQVTSNMLQYLELSATAQIQAEALQSIAEDEAKTKATRKWDEALHPRDKEGQFAEKPSLESRYPVNTRTLALPSGRSTTWHEVQLPGGGHLSVQPGARGGWVVAGQPHSYPTAEDAILDARLLAASREKPPKPAFRSSTAEEAEAVIAQARENGQRVLFHSGDASIAPELAEGIQPQMGDWVQEVLSGATDDEEGIQQIQDDPANAVAYYSETPEWVSMKASRVMKDRHVTDVTPEELEKHGHLSIVVVDPDDEDLLTSDENQMVYRVGSDEARRENIPFGVEPGDIYTQNVYVPDATLTGKELLRFLNRNYPQANLLHGSLEAFKFDPNQLRDAKGRWATGGLTTDYGNVYLHGTAQAFLDDIIQNGLSGEHTGKIHTYDIGKRKAGQPVGDPGHVYMTTDEAEARRYAESAATEIAYGKNPIPPTLQDIVYSVEVPEAERTALAWESGTEVGGGMPAVVTVTLPPHIVKQLRKDKKSDILTPRDRVTPLRSKVARSYKGTIKPEWITSISYQTKDIATGVETWHTIKPSEWKAPPPTRLPHAPKELKAAAEGETFYIPLVLPLASPTEALATKFDPTQPRDNHGRWTDEEGVTHVGDEVELYHGTSRTRANKILKEGLKIRAVRKPTMGGDPESSRNYIWMAKRARSAQSYSEMHAHPAVLRIRLPKALYDKLREHGRNSGPDSVWSREPIPAKHVSLFDLDALATKRDSMTEGLGGLTWKFDEAKHPRGDDGRFIEATAPRIFSRPEDVVEETSWGEKSWRWRITEEEAKRYGGTVGQGSGRLLTGEPIPPEKRPETLYHVTTNAPAVESSGVLLGQRGDAGLGGGQAEGVSFTASPEDAIVIQRELRRAVRVARGEVTIEDVQRWAREDEQEAGLPEGALNKAVAYAQEGYEANKFTLEHSFVSSKDVPEGAPTGYVGPITPEERERIRRSLVKDALNAYLQTREEAAARAMGQTEWPWNAPLMKNPLLFGRQEHLAKINPEDVQTLTISASQIPAGALVTTGSDKFLHEVRAYSDVPIRRKPVVKWDESQHPRDKEGKFTDGAQTKESDGRAGGSGGTGVPAKAKGRPDAVPRAQAVADAYNQGRGHGPVEHAYAAVDEQRAGAIADAYDALPLEDDSPEVQAAYEALATEIKAQYAHIVASGFTFTPWTKEGQPYATSSEMAADVRDNNHMYFFTGGEPNKYMAAVDPDTGITVNDMFRAVHDYFGHAAGGYGFGARGEENAWMSHSQMLSPLARRALTTETRGQNSWVNFGRQNYDAEGNYLKIPPQDRPFATQKLALLPEHYALLPWETALKFDPNQPRDDYGRWAQVLGNAARLFATKYPDARKVAEASRRVLSGEAQQPISDTSPQEVHIAAAERLVEAIRHAPEHETPLFRGLGADDPIEAIESLKVGDKVTLGQVTAFTEQEDVAAYYAERASGGAVGHTYQLMTTGPVKSLATDEMTRMEHKEHLTEGVFEVVAIHEPKSGIPVAVGADVTGGRQFFVFHNRSITLRQVGVF